MAWLVLLYCLWITPVRAGAAVTLDGAGPRARWGVIIWGAGLRGQARIQRSSEGRLLAEVRSARGNWHRTMLKFRGQKQGKHPGSPASRLNSIVLILRRGVRLTALEVNVRAGGDAAFAALLAGFLQALGGALPRARVRCRPVFGGQTAAQVHCIVETRLGTL